jgi:hypothetical protein
LPDARVNTACLRNVVHDRANAFAEVCDIVHIKILSARKLLQAYLIISAERRGNRNDGQVERRVDFKQRPLGFLVLGADDDARGVHGVVHRLPCARNSDCSPRGLSRPDEVILDICSTLSFVPTGTVDLTTTRQSCVTLSAISRQTAAIYERFALPSASSGVPTPMRWRPRPHMRGIVGGKEQAVCRDVLFEQLFEPNFVDG